MPARWQQRVALPMMVLGVLALGWEGGASEVAGQDSAKIRPQTLQGEPGMACALGENPAGWVRCRRLVQTLEGKLLILWKGIGKLDGNKPSPVHASEIIT